MVSKPLLPPLLGATLQRCHLGASHAASVQGWGFSSSQKVTGAVLDHGTTPLDQPHSSAAAAPPDPVRGVWCEMGFIYTCGGLEGSDCASL